MLQFVKFWTKLKLRPNNVTVRTFQKFLLIDFFISSGTDLMTRSRSFVKTNNSQNNFRNSLRRYQPNNNEDIMSQSADQSIISRLAPVYQPSPLMSRRNIESRSTRATSPRSTLRKFNSAIKLNEENVTPPGSPPSYRRSGSRDETGKNVFHRLVAGTNIGEQGIYSSWNLFSNIKAVKN